MPNKPETLNRTPQQIIDQFAPGWLTFYQEFVGRMESKHAANPNERAPRHDSRLTRARKRRVNPPIKP
jgi:hypothetical protein